MRKKLTLLDRTQGRNKWDATKKQWPVAEDHIRAELDRLARQVKKLYPESGATRCVEEALGNAARNCTINDVLALIREARK